MERRNRISRQQRTVVRDSELLSKQDTGTSWKKTTIVVSSV